jgi:hypothetical protein
MKMFFILAGILLALVLLSWLGLQIKPAPFAAFSQQQPELETVPLPAGLPVPVERFYRTLYGDRVPVIETAVIKGRATMSPFLGIPLPARFIFVHNAGKDYRHYIEATFFGLPILKVNEGYVDGRSFFEFPTGSLENDPSTNQAAVLGLWAEASWFPSIWVTDPRVHWEPVDDHTALLFVPFDGKEENFVVRFDPATGYLDVMEAMRFRDSGPQAKKILWITKTIPGKTIPGTKLEAVGSATWLDQGKPWAIFSLEELDYNVDVSEYIHQKGP